MRFSLNTLGVARPSALTKWTAMSTSKSCRFGEVLRRTKRTETRPPIVTRRGSKPTFSIATEAAGADQEMGMKLAEIVEVVGHAAPHQVGGIVFQQLEQLEHPVGVRIQPGDAARPREPEPRALGHQATHVRVRIARPPAQHRKRTLGMFGDVRTDFGGGLGLIRRAAGS